ncbi:MAG TPA: glycosyltransferase [Caldithrix sp.]|nr:glycosyltransferase [Caldithrix sp.]
MKSIAILHYSCPPVVGGVEEIIRQQAFLFQRYFHPIKILAGAGSQFSDKILIEINPLLSSQNNEIIKAQNNYSKNQQPFRALTRKIFTYLKNNLQHFDVLIAHNVLSMPYNLPLAYALHRLANQKIISVVGWNHDSPFFYRNYSSKFNRKPWSVLKKYNPSIAYITISQSRVQEFSSLYGGKNEIKVIPNGIDPIGFFRLDTNTVRLIRENELFETDLLLVQPSRLHPRKNIELSIRVLRALRERGIAAKLLLTGAHDPHERITMKYYRQLKVLAQNENVEKHIIMIADYIFNSGEKLPADRVIMRDLYHISDLLFLPSAQEGFGIPLLEAGMIKLPIACSDIPPFKSIAAENVCYFSLDETPQAIAGKIVDFLNELKPHRMYRNVIRQYVWDNIYHKQLKPFIETLDSGSAKTNVLPET